MSQRRRVSRDDQRRARALMQERSISYMQALSVVRSDSSAPAQSNGRATAVTGWLKAMHYRHDGWTIQPGERSWISDISRHDQDGNRIYRQDGTPWGEPSWKIGDRVGLYFGGTLRVPVLVEVVALPRFDEEFVQTHNDGGEPDAGERWPWVTEVRGVLAQPLRQAPTLDVIDVRHESMRQRSRLLLTPDQLHALEQALR
jgi:hypothetical protein